MQDSNFWYYTLSAIPQTLAAIIALAATFAVVSLGSVSKKIRVSRKDLRRFILLLTSRLDITEKEIHTIEPLSDKNFLKIFKKGLETLKKEPTLGLDETNFKKFKTEMHRIIEEEWKSFYGADNTRIYGYLEMKKNLLEELLYKRKQIFQFMALSLILVTLVIIGSLIILPQYNYFNGSRMIVLLTIKFASLAIIITGISVWKIANTE